MIEDTFDWDPFIYTLKNDEYFLDKRLSKYTTVLFSAIQICLNFNSFKFFFLARLHNNYTKIKIKNRLSYMFNYKNIL